MNKLYIDTSIFNRALDTGVDATAMREAFSKLRLEPATGLLTVNELARTFLKPSNADRAKALFALLRDLDPVYQPEIRSVLKAEVTKLRTGAAVLPFLDELQHASARVEVARLAGGFFDERASRFLVDTLRRKNRDRESHKSHLANISSAGATDPKVAALQTFDDVWAYFDSKGALPSMIAEVLRGDVSLREAKELAQRLQSFPAIATAVRSDVYLNFIMIAHAEVPGKDKLDDYKHAIGAAYCSAFLTADMQVAALRHVLPHVRLLTWNSVLAPTVGAV